MADRMLTAKNSASHGHDSWAEVDEGVYEGETVSAFTVPAQEAEAIDGYTNS